jgi:thioredoxin reductase (NADPH)
MAAAPEAYDLVVIGGGSGGLAASKEAKQLLGPGGKVCVLDFVKPSPAGSTWGLGGTCVNVGCIPKKLMHQAGIHNEGIRHLCQKFGHSPETKFEWPALVGNIQEYIGTLNDGYTKALKDENVEYFNAFGTFVDPNTIALDFDGKEPNRNIIAKQVLIATGGRPYVLGCPGQEFAIDSDDIFMKKEDPGKICIVGASYIALECAGFLTALGYDVTVLVRSILLRGFDQEISGKIEEFMAAHGTKFIKKVTVAKVEKDGAGKLKVFYGSKEAPGSEVMECDTLLAAIGRSPCTKELGLDKAGVKMDEKGYIPVDKECTNVPHIYALGDVITGIWELTPVAIQAGKMLAQRLYGGAVLHMDYHTIATTVFTPLEYSAIGYSEEDAIKEYGEAALEIYIETFKPLEWSMGDADPSDHCSWNKDVSSGYMKLICVKAEDERVVGFHYMGPNAGEVAQGFSTAMRLGATKLDFDMTVGIHPTTAERATTLKVTKSSGADAAAGGC